MSASCDGCSTALDGEVGALERGASPVARLRRRVGHRRAAGERSTSARSASTVEPPGISDEGFLLLDTDAGRVALSIGEVVGVLEEPMPLRSGS